MARMLKIILSALTAIALVSCTKLGERDLAWTDFGTGAQPAPANSGAADTSGNDTFLVDSLHAKTSTGDTTVSNSSDSAIAAVDTSSSDTLSPNDSVARADSNTYITADSMSTANDTAATIPIDTAATNSSYVDTAASDTGAVNAPPQAPVRTWGLVYNGSAHNYIFEDIDGYDNNNVWACGRVAKEYYGQPDSGLILYFDGSSWKRQALPDENATAMVGALHALSASAAYAVALVFNAQNDRFVSVIKHDGAGWRSIAQKQIYGATSLPTDIHVFSDSDMFVCADDRLFRVVGLSEWQDQGIEVDRIAFRANNFGYASGKYKNLYAFDGLVWRVIDTRDPAAISLAPDSTLAALGGGYPERDSLWLFRGAESTEAFDVNPESQTAYGYCVFARSGDEIWTGRLGNYITKYNGNDILEYRIADANWFKALWFADKGAGWAACNEKLFVYR